ETVLYFTKSEKNFVFNADDIRTPYMSSDRINAAKKTGILKNGKRWFPNEAGRLCTDVWEFTSVRHKNKVNGKTVKQNHPTPKPEEMVERMIKASTKEGDLVLDLFCGTGTTSYCARRLNRLFIACDNNLEYCEYARSRCKI
ncbi:MAG: site-specific DNA-methyltransferase, partial [Clostridia bacterium]|nr:site-specific DNA-methyltransferase [Clostridia bacterium]